MPTYDDSDDDSIELQANKLAKKELLADVYSGGNLADPSKRNKRTQQETFANRTMPSSGINLLEEFQLGHDFTGIEGRSFLTHIVRAYNKPALEWALKQAPALVNHYFDEEQHPLLKAAELNSKEMVKMLLDAGADPNLLAYKTSPSNKLAALMRHGKRNVLHETVGAAVQADEKISKDIKKMVSAAAVRNAEDSAHSVMFSETDRVVNEKKSLFNKKK